MISFFLAAILFSAGHSLTCNTRSCLSTYTVESGDYLWAISQKLGVAFSSLQQCNPELTTSTMYPGQVICSSCTTQPQACTCSKYAVTSSSNTWNSFADAQSTTIGYLSDCNPSANIATATSVTGGLNLCVKCRVSERNFTISPYYETVVSLNANVGSISSSGLKAATFAFVTGSGSGTRAVPSWEGTALSTYSSVVNGFSGSKTISFGGSAAGQELAIKWAAARGSPLSLASKYKSVVDTYGSSIVMDFDIEGNDILNTAANNLRAQALKNVLSCYPSVRVTYTIPVGPSGFTDAAKAMIINSIINGVTPYAINIMTFDYGASNRGINYDVKAIEAAYMQILKINKDIKMGVTTMIGLDDSGATRTVADIESLLMFATSKPYIYQFGYWAYHRDVPGTVGVAPCTNLAYCAGITGFSTKDYLKKFMAFSN